MSLGKIPQVLKCATLMDKHKKQKNKDFPPRFEPEKNSSCFKMHLCFPSTWCISNPGNIFPSSNLGGESLLFLYFMSTINMARLDPWWKFFGSKVGGESLFFCFYFCPSTWRILKPGEFSPDSNLGEESLFVLVLYFCHQHSAFGTLGIFLGSKIGGESL